MTLPYAMTRQACRARQRMPEELRARLDRLLLGLRLVPTIGLYDKDTQQFAANLNDGSAILKVYYMVVQDPQPQLVVLDIRAFPKSALAGVYERVRAQRRTALAG